jgi:homoaconitase/3-isopropylmalate dehydratase large subunit
MPERHALTLSLTYKQVAILRQAVFDFADHEYEKRMRRLRSDPTATMRSAVEVAAEELASLITEATDVAMTPEVSHVPNV